MVACGPGSRSGEEQDAAEVGGPETSEGNSSSSGGATTMTGPIVDDIGSMPPLICKVPADDINGVACEQEAPPDSFAPEVQWTWTGPDGLTNVVITPLVANLTDDNQDGEIDLCDVPDVVVVACDINLDVNGTLFVLDGLTGEEHYRSIWPVSCNTNPALGDIDGDGRVDIVAAAMRVDADGFGGRLTTLEADGSLKWEGDHWGVGAAISAIALADLEGDGEVEIVAGNGVYDSEGRVRFVSEIEVWNHSASVPVDLDGDGDLEVVFGNAAVEHDGEVVFHRDDLHPGFPAIADLDGDGTPEIVLTNEMGITILAADGTSLYEELNPPGVAIENVRTWTRPAALHDMDGDGLPEIAVSAAVVFGVYEMDGSVLWSHPVDDESGVAAGTAFDFLGDGNAEAMYADERDMFVLDGSARPLLKIPRRSATGIEYPVVADIDNDGSAEIVVVSNIGEGEEGYHSVQAIRDEDNRWIQARRIWNQHAYSVTNVREDGTIPAQQAPNWATFNTFRTNSQIEGGLDCIPEG